jgi:YrbI family 3-deoxy-D-manno-octulosonate 8-phosphate phosphatase
VRRQLSQVLKHSLSKSHSKRRLRAQIFPKVLAIDFDGCLTNDFVYLNTDGIEFVQVTRKDGLGAARLSEIGIQVVIVSSEKNGVVTIRARKIGVDVIQGVTNKVEALRKYVSEKGFSWEATWFVGNELNDRDVMGSVTFSLCPKDASPEIRRVADVILPVKGGMGILNYIARNLEGHREAPSRGNS